MAEASVSQAEAALAVAQTKVTRSEFRAPFAGTVGTLGVRVGEVARAFLEYALEAYYRRELKLEPQPRPGKFTLYPKE